MTQNVYLIRPVHIARVVVLVDHNQVLHVLHDRVLECDPADITASGSPHVLILNLFCVLVNTTDFIVMFFTSSGFPKLPMLH